MTSNPRFYPVWSSGQLRDRCIGYAARHDWVGYWLTRAMAYRDGVGMPRDQAGNQVWITGPSNDDPSWVAAWDAATPEERAVLRAYWPGELDQLQGETMMNEARTKAEAVARAWARAARAAKVAWEAWVDAAAAAAEAWDATPARADEASEAASDSYQDAAWAAADKERPR